MDPVFLSAHDELSRSGAEWKEQGGFQSHLDKVVRITRCAVLIWRDVRLTRQS